MLVIEKSPHDRCGYRLTAELGVAAPREEVFAFFADATQLETITPPRLHFAVLTPRPIEMQEGTIIDYRLRLWGVPLGWRSKISQWQPPREFVDEQLRGPYRYWRHRHLFEETEGGTLVRDIVEYAVPLGLIMHPLVVRRDLTKIFEFRQEMLSRIFTPLA